MNAPQAGSRRRGVIFAPSPQTMVFLHEAVRRHRLRYERDGMAAPAEIADVLDYLAAGSGVSEGQGGSPVAPVPAVQDVVSMTPLLVTYDSAAALLGVSLSTIKRRVSDGVLRPVSVGEGARRLRVCDLKDYVASLGDTDDEKTTGAA